MSSPYKRKRSAGIDDTSLSKSHNTPSKRQRFEAPTHKVYVEAPRLPNHQIVPTVGSILPPGYSKSPRRSRERTSNDRSAHLTPRSSRVYVSVPRLENHPKTPSLASLLPRRDLSTSLTSNGTSLNDVTNDIADMDLTSEIIEESDVTLPEEPLASGDSDLPVRYLDHFSIFDDKTHRMISLDDVENPKFGDEPYFIGQVTAKMERLDEEEEGDDMTIDDDDETVIQFTELDIKSSAIVEIWESVEPERDGLVSEQSEIWIRTKFAWYILNRPSQEYMEHFFPRWIRHKLLLLMAYLAPRTSETDRFRKRFLKNEARWAEYEFGRRLDFKDLKNYMPHALRYAISREEEVSAVQKPLFENLCSEYCPELSLTPGSPHSSNYEETGSYPERERQPPISAQYDSRLTRTFCTPFIKGIAKKYFPSLQEDEEQEDSDELDMDEDEGDDHSELIDIGPPSRMSAIELSVKGIFGNRENLSWVKIGPHIYTPGDTVMIRPDSADAFLVHPRELPESVWFGKIIRLHRRCTEHVAKPRQGDQEDDDIYAHILWFHPAAKTSIKELAHPQELIAVDQCDDKIPVESFIGPCSNRHLAIDEEEPTPGENPLDFFHRYFWDCDNDDAFLDIDLFLHDRLLHAPVHTPCPSCDQDKGHIKSKEPQTTKDGILLNGIDYHPLDFVYVLPEEDGQEYHIAQIQAISSTTVQLHMLARAERSSAFYDERLLEDSVLRNPKIYSVDHLEGKCRVFRQKPKLDVDDDEFFCPGIKHWQPCRLCEPPSASSNPPLHSPIKGLDLFSGAGGLSLGLESTGLVQTQWAVEYDISSALTFSESHPDCTVYNACINALFRHAHGAENGEAPEPVTSLNGNELPPLPEKGDVDIIYGGPPCQGFSRLNHCPKADDPRNHLVLTFISAVEMLQPRYVIMENVRGLLSFRLGAQQAGLNRTEGGIPRGFVKLIKRLLASLNYQVRYGILHAGHYGAPQLRRRVVFIAAKRGVYLPKLPQPSHITPNTRMLNIVVDDDHRFTVSTRRMESAPLGPVTVSDVIGDLPQWEWKNPHQIYPATSHQKKEEADRANSIPFIEWNHKADKTDVPSSGPSNPMHYEDEPRTRYQKRSRLHSNQISQHWCPGFGEKEIERICTIPMVKNRFVDHNDLPRLLRIGLYGDKRHIGRYGRLDANGVFDTALGTLVPNSPTGRILHPTLHRILTIREMARSQGFPDRIEFLKDPRTKSITAITKQIGNAVPIPMAAAVGKEILKAYRRTRRKEIEEERDGSVEL